MYGEFFDIPAPDELVFISSFSGGEVFRSGCTFRRGHGRIFYFRPGDQEYPTYHHRTCAGSSPTASPGPAPTGRNAAVPVLLRYETGEFFQGQGYRDRCSDVPDDPPARRTRSGWSSSAPAAWAGPGWPPSPARPR